MNGHGRKYNMGSRFFTGNSRSEKRAANILGVISGGSQGANKYRSQKLAEVEKYLNGTQYDHLMNWDQAQAEEDHIPMSSRKPKVIYPFAQVFADRLSSKLAGNSTFPKLKIEDDPESEYFLNMVINGAFIKPKILDAARDLAVYRSTFIRFKIVDGVLRIEKYNPNYCYPVFKATGQLESVTIKYVYDDPEDFDPKTKRAKQKWFKLELTETADILYDNPEFNAQVNEEPIFQVVESAQHELGFVQGQWISDGESSHSPDGDKEPFVCQIKGFIDALNYNLSQTQQATAYGLEPQLLLSGMDEDEVDSLIKSSAKGWLLGREGKAEFLEAAGSGLDSAKETRDDFFKRVQDIARIVMLDPEKMAANAQSGKAMEVMHAPLVELVNELRPWLEKGLIELMQKIISALAIMNVAGFETQFEMPPGWQPKSLDIKAMWPPIFELTTQDKQQIVSLALQASSGNIISRVTALKWIQSQGVDFGVEDIEAEEAKINSQQQFGGFF